MAAELQFRECAQVLGGVGERWGRARLNLKGHKASEGASESHGVLRRDPDLADYFFLRVARANSPHAPSGPLTLSMTSSSPEGRSL